MYWFAPLENRHFHDLNPWIYGHEDVSPGQVWGYVTREEWVIYYVNSGKGVLISDGETYHIHQKQIFLIRPGASTKIIADKNDPWYFHWVHLDGALTERLYSLPVVFDFETNLFDIMDHVDQYEKDKELFLASQLMLLFIELFSSKSVHPLIGSIRNYINAHYADRSVIDAAAQKLNFDRHYLARVFQKYEGISMHDYLMHVRMNRAHALLLQGRSCLQTAEALGYSDIAAFSRSFKQYFGFSPSMLRKGLRPAEKPKKQVP